MYVCIFLTFSSWVLASNSEDKGTAVHVRVMRTYIYRGNTYTYNLRSS
jgi:hypothetical protein